MLRSGLLARVNSLIKFSSARLSIPFPSRVEEVLLPPAPRGLLPPVLSSRVAGAALQVVVLTPGFLSAVSDPNFEVGEQTDLSLPFGGQCI